MQKDKHNIYSKEELLKLIKEGKNAPADMDGFELEALEGLKMLDNHDVLNNLNKDVDKIVLAETKKEKQRKAIYYFSAAASLLLLVGLIFLFKNSDIIQNEKVVAAAEKPKEEKIQIDLTPPPQAETSTTYETKEPEQQNRTQKGTIVLAENKTKQKQDNNLEQEKNLTTKTDNIAQQQDESKFAQSDKAKKIAVASQSAIAFENRDKNNDVMQAPSASKTDSKKEEEKAQPDMFFANSLAKNKTSKNHTEAAFFNSDSTFVVYAKQNLKISSTQNSGIIVVEFLINKDGTTKNIKIVKPLNNCDVCSKDVIDLIKSIKRWQPVTENGKPVSSVKKMNVQYN
jgi:DNA-binding XRE family transcriptional regulator